MGSGPSNGSTEHTNARTNLVRALRAIGHALGEHRTQQRITWLEIARRRIRETLLELEHHGRDDDK